MNSGKKKKPRGMKHKIREEKKREQRIGLAVTVAILIAIISVSGFFIYSMLGSSPQKQDISSTSEPRAVMVDHLSLTAPNQAFIQTATNILEQVGFTVDYYPGEEVTVDFYRNLPTRGYKLIILRVHSTAIYAHLFTSEPYSISKYVYEQLRDQVVRVSFTEEPPYYFGISPLFVKLTMNGRFENTIVVMMGCDGLKNIYMAEAFINKGAKTYIGWSESVSALHTDLSATHLLQHLIIEKQTIGKAVEKTMKEVGADPVYESLLVYYPLEAGDYTIQNIIGDLISNSTQVKTLDILKRMRTLFSFF